MKRRAIKLQNRYTFAYLIDYVLIAAHEVNDNEPRTYEEVVNSKDKLQWQKTMDGEITSLMKNETWKLIEKLEKKQ